MVEALPSAAKVGAEKLRVAELGKEQVELQLLCMWVNQNKRVAEAN